MVFIWKKRGFKIFFQYIVVAKYGKMSGSWSTLEAFASCSLYNYGCILCLVVAGCGGMEFICSFFVSPCNKCVFFCQHTCERITVKTSLYTCWKWVNLGSHADTKNTANAKPIMTIQVQDTLSCWNQGVCDLGFTHSSIHVHTLRFVYSRFCCSFWYKRHYFLLTCKPVATRWGCEFDLLLLVVGAILW